MSERIQAVKRMCSDFSRIPRGPRHDESDLVYKKFTALNEAIQFLCEELESMQSEEN